MNKVASQSQIELCKAAAVDRFAQYGIPAEVGARLFDLKCEELQKQAQATALQSAFDNMTPEQATAILGLLGLGGGAGIGAAVAGKGNRSKGALIGAGIGGLGGVAAGQINPLNQGLRQLLAEYAGSAPRGPAPAPGQTSRGVSGPASKKIQGANAKVTKEEGELATARNQQADARREGAKSRTQSN